MRLKFFQIEGAEKMSSRITPLTFCQSTNRRAKSQGLNSTIRLTCIHFIHFVSLGFI